MNDWQSTLRQFLDKNPELPEGPEAMPEQQHPAEHPQLDIILDRKGRAGKSATIICGFTEATPDSEISALARWIKQRLATGGSARGGEILIQGDRRKDVAALLNGKGYKTRIV